VTRQAWQNYESGVRAALLRTDLQERLAHALGLERADLIRERDRQAGVGPSEHRGMAEDGPPAQELEVLGRVKASPSGPQVYDIDEPESMVDVSWMFGPKARTLRVAGDSMTGYVESGQLVTYDVSLWPARGEGCVVELLNGEVYVKEYLETSQGVLKVKQRLPEEVLSFPMAEVKGVYKIRIRMT
jgi:phage repressor protein C with HTH and peptisase S24 domain